MSYTRWKAERAAWGAIPSGFSAVRLFLMLVMAPFVLLAALGGARKRQPNPRSDAIVGCTILFVLFAVSGGAFAYAGFTGVNARRKREHSAVGS